MIVFLDTDILIDVALDRTPFSEPSSKVLDLIQLKKVDAFIAWHSISNFYYLVASQKKGTSAKNFIGDLLKFIKIAPGRTKDVRAALKMKMNDFEDALQVSASLSCNAEIIITRNIKHYKNAPLPAMSPPAFLKIIPS